MRERNKMGKMVLELHYAQQLVAAVRCGPRHARGDLSTDHALTSYAGTPQEGPCSRYCAPCRTVSSAAPEQARCEEASTASGAPIQLEQNATHEAHMAAGAAAPACRGKMALWSLMLPQAQVVKAGDRRYTPPRSPPNPVLGHDSTYATARTTTGSLPRSRHEPISPRPLTSSSTSGDCAAVPSPERVLAITSAMPSPPLPGAAARAHRYPTLDQPPPSPPPPPPLLPPSLPPAPAPGRAARAPTSASHRAAALSSGAPSPARVRSMDLQRHS